MKEGADARSVTDHSPLSDGTLEMEDGSRRRKFVRLVQRLKGFVRLVYLICELFFLFCLTLLIRSIRVRERC